MEGNLIRLFIGAARGAHAQPVLDHQLSLGVERLEAKGPAAVERPDPDRDGASRLERS